MTDQEFYKKFVIPKFTKKSQIEFLEMRVRDTKVKRKTAHFFLESIKEDSRYDLVDNKLYSDIYSTIMNRIQNDLNYYSAKLKFYQEIIDWSDDNE